VDCSCHARGLLITLHEEAMATYVLYDETFGMCMGVYLWKDGSHTGDIH
jgi:hypothetical protein